MCDAKSHLTPKIGVREKIPIFFGSPTYFLRLLCLLVNYLKMISIIWLMFKYALSLKVYQLLYIL